VGGVGVALYPQLICIHMYVWVAAGGRFFFIIDLTVSDLRAICIRNVSAQPLIRIHIRIRIAIAFPIPGY